MKKKNKLKGLQRRKAVAGYLFIAPFIIGFLMFMVKPLFQSLWMSFSNVTLSPNGFDISFGGLVNYNRAFFVDIDFNRLLTEELSEMIIKTLAIMVYSFFIALILNQKFRGRGAIRAIFFLPVIMASGVILNIDYDNALMNNMQSTIVEDNKFANVSDLIEDILDALGLGRSITNIVYTLVDSIYDIAVASGIQIIIFISGLQTIPKAMYEAADIEGCSAWEKLWKITFPMISPLFLVNWVYTIVDFCMRSDNTVMEKIQQAMTVNLLYGFASAMAWAYFAIVALILGVTCFIISKVVYYYD